jgi:hypothetical protein
LRTPLILIMSALLLPCVALTDGGRVCLRETSGVFLVTVFVAPQPLQAGPIDTSVLVQDRETGAVLLDAMVDLAIQRDDGSSHPSLTRATRGQATNKLLQSSTIALPAPGRWALRVSVSRGQKEAAFTTILQVAPAASRLAAIWPLLLLPPLGIALFALHQAIRNTRG